MAKKKEKKEKKQDDTTVGNVKKSEYKPDVETKDQDPKPDSEDNSKTEEEPATKKNMESDLPLVNLAVFCNLSGKKFDQIAGFRNYAKRKKLGPMTIPQWRKSMEEFHNKPMR